jgi:hypothetical protein
MKRQKRLTRREKKILDPGPRPPGPAGQHIHCVACGRHIDPDEFEGTPATAVTVRCDHGSTFASCVGCSVKAEALVAEHDRTGQPVKAAAAWH